MKRILLSLMLGASIVSNVSPMKRKLMADSEQQQKRQCTDQFSELTSLVEQSLDMFTEVIVLLDGKSFSRLTQVCKSLEHGCSAIPVCRLHNITFFAAVAHNNNNLINRFTPHYAEWIFEPNTTQAIIDDTTMITKHQFGPALDGFFQEKSSVACISKGDTFVGYAFFLEEKNIGDTDELTEYLLYFNKDQEPNDVQESLKNCLKLWNKDNFSNPLFSNLPFLQKKTLASGFSRSSGSECGGSLPIESVLSPHDFGLAVIALIAKKRGDTKVFKVLKDNKALYPELFSCFIMYIQ